MTVLLGQANYVYDGNPYLWGCDITTSEPNRIVPISGAAISLPAKLIRIVPYLWSCDITISEAYQGSPISNPILTNTCAHHVPHTSNHAPRGTSYSEHVLLAYPGLRPLPDGL